jgi:hypothetical protein
VGRLDAHEGAVLALGARPDTLSSSSVGNCSAGLLTPHSYNLDIGPVHLHAV